MKKLVQKILGLLVIGFVTGCGNTSGDIVKLGVVGQNNEVWEFVQQELATEGIQLEIVSFSDYHQPNLALAAGDIDLNSFQTHIFLEEFNEAQDENLTPIGDTVLAPLGIYSEKITDLSQLQEGDTLAVPNDPSNRGRALSLLQTAGLITLDPASGPIPIVADIIENNLNLTIRELDASQTARSLQDVAGAVINNGMAVDAGFIPSQDAVFLEPVSDASTPYINCIVARPEDVDHEIYQKVVEVYQRDATKELIAEVTKASSIPAWN